MLGKANAAIVRAAYMHGEVRVHLSLMMPR